MFHPRLEISTSDKNQRKCAKTNNLNNLKCQWALGREGQIEMQMPLRSDKVRLLVLAYTQLYV